MTSISAARLKVTTRWSYAIKFLYSLHPVEVPSLPNGSPMAVDEYWRMYYTQEALDKMTVDEAATIIMHEMEHCIRRHFTRFRRIESLTGREPMTPELKAKALRWNYATDAAINDDLKRECFPFPKYFTPILPSLYKFRDGLTEEQYYRMLEEDNSDGGNDGDDDNNGSTAGDEESGTPANGGSGVDGIKRPWELPAPDSKPADTGDGESAEQIPGLLRPEQDSILADLAERIEAAGKQPGQFPADHHRDWAKEFQRSQINWKTVLRRFVNRSLQRISGMQDYSYRRPARRNPNIANVLLPSMHATKMDIAVLVDTSGSMDADTLRDAVAEVNGVLKALPNREGIHFYSGDEELHDLGRIHTNYKGKLRGGGGTDMDSLMRKIAARKPKPTCVICLTDGYTIWDSAPLGCQAIVVVIGDCHYEPPTWAKTLRLGDVDST